MNNKILLIGASGLLGTELLKKGNLICPDHASLDVTDERAKIIELIDQNNIDIVINCAAIIDNRILEKRPHDAVDVNIIGAANVAIACMITSVRLVYISTDYVYKGDRGNYTESDEILPFNFYAWTKLGGECSTRGVKNHLIIRTSFGSDKFGYQQAFTDKWSSKDYVDVIAPLIYDAAVSPLTGIVNIGTERKTLYTHAKERNDVKPVKISETNFFTPYDTSMNLQKWMDYKDSNPIATPHTNCRICGSSNMVKYLDLGLMPLANNLEFTSLRAKEKERFPLQVLFCEDCALSQLSVVINPGKMFSHYTYRSSVNGGYVKHCRKMAKELANEYSLHEDRKMIDIAGNDGTLLREFRDETGIQVLNVDPASNLAAISEAQGIPTIADFWGMKVADMIFDEMGTVDLITATNVFAHVPNMKEFISAANRVLSLNGILVIECPYLIDFIDKLEFDTIYHEHLSYVSVLPMKQLCYDCGMKIISVSKQNIHGGTIRMIITNQSSILTANRTVDEFINLEIENGLNKVAKYTNWSDDVNAVIQNFGTSLLNLKKEGFRISGFAASAKGNILLNSAGINTDIMDYICDQTPEKIGMYSPGTGIPIVHIQELVKNPCDYLVILSWNFKEELISVARKNGFKGKFIIPSPEFKIVE